MLGIAVFDDEKIIVDNVGELISIIIVATK